MIDRGKVMERLSYNPETGDFIWLQRRGGRCMVGQLAGSITKDGYRKASIDYVPHGLHRLAFLIMTGEMPIIVDHINGNRSDNRWVNLRASDYRLNGENQRHSKRATIGGYFGVTRHKSGRWQAQIKVNGKTRYLGLHPSAEDAHAAYLAAKRRMHEGCTI